MPNAVELTSGEPRGGNNSSPKKPDALSAQDVAELVTRLRSNGHHISEAVAGSLYGSGKTRDEVLGALFAEIGRCAEISDICEARGVPEVKAELFASGVSADGATARIGEAVTIKATVRTAARGAYPMTDAEQAKLASDLITGKVMPEHAGHAILALAASRDEATAIVGRAPRSRVGGDRDDGESMRRELRRQGMEPVNHRGSR